MDDSVQFILLVAFVYVAALVLGYNPLGIVLGVLSGLWQAFVDAIANAVSNSLTSI